MTIKEIREHSGLSQGEFCKRYGIPKGTLCHWESGERKPPLYVLSLTGKSRRNKNKKKIRKNYKDAFLRPFLLKKLEKNIDFLYSIGV